MPRTRARRADDAKAKEEVAAAADAATSMTGETSTAGGKEVSRDSSDSAADTAVDAPQEKETVGNGSSVAAAGKDGRSGETPGAGSDVTAATTKLSMEERTRKMKELRRKMADSSMANRRAVASEANQHKKAARTSAGAQRKLDKAERTLEQRDALERGEDWERIRAMGYTIEDNDRWEDQLDAKEQTKDQGPQDANSSSERQYRRLVSQMKPGVKGSGEKQRDASGSTRAASSSSALAVRPESSTQGQMVRKNDLYPDASNLSYGTHRPDDAALDRVSAHLNSEADRRTKFSRKRADDGDGDVTYINDKNKHYNKKIARYFDKYTTEIRENFERGTAL